MAKNTPGTPVAVNGLKIKTNPVQGVSEMKLFDRVIQMLQDVQVRLVLVMLIIWELRHLYLVLFH